MKHWLQRCPNLDGLRQHTFGSPSPPLGVLTTDPEKVLAVARATFKSFGRRQQQHLEVLLNAMPLFHVCNLTTRSLYLEGSKGVVPDNPTQKRYTQFQDEPAKRQVYLSPTIS